MSTLQCANVWMESTANNRLQYAGSNTIVITTSGANAAIFNSSGSISLPTAPFYEATTTVTANYTITTNYNAFSPGPLTINSGVTVTVPSGSVWTIS